MKIIADLHVHSRFSRAVSSQMEPKVINEWARKKGIDLVATGDWTHPIWVRELKSNLEEVGEGVYGIKEEKNSSLFILSTELSSIYKQGGKVRRIHLVVIVPSFETAEKVRSELTKRGVNLLSDGRPIMSLSAKEVVDTVLTIDEKSLIIPAHIWTPWFSLYGANSGFDSIGECFSDFSKNIYAVETGLSSDPAMNWRIEELEGKSIVSFSDAHSPTKLGREATILNVGGISYEAIRNAIIGKSGAQIEATIEFYPEEGKYHYTGHRKCGVVYSPKEGRKKGSICPVCGRKLTVGVMSRVETLASRDVETKSKIDPFGVRWIEDKKQIRPSYVMLVPLLEILSESLLVGSATKTVMNAYEQLISAFGSEFNVLLKTPLAELSAKTDEKIVEGIKKVRLGDIVIEPGYDGIFGKVEIWKASDSNRDVKIEQSALF